MAGPGVRHGLGRIPSHLDGNYGIGLAAWRYHDIAYPEQSMKATEMKRGLQGLEFGCLWNWGIPKDVWAGPGGLVGFYNDGAMGWFSFLILGHFLCHFFSLGQR